MSTAETAEIGLVSTSALGDLAQLEPLAREIFGTGQRPRGWFARKLHREVVSPRASRLVVAPAHAPGDPAGWLGYGLLGLPPSLEGVARTAGIGLRGVARGHGWGAQLLTALMTAAHEHGRDTLEVPASLDSVGFYRRIGLREHDRHGTWLAFGRGRKEPDPPANRHAPQPWSTSPTGAIVASWLAEAWDRTPASARYRWANNQKTLNVSVEGVAHLVHRWASVGPASLAVPGLDRWLEHLPNGTPALLSNVPHSAAELARALEDAGWVCVQQSVAMRGSTRPG